MGYSIDLIFLNHHLLLVLDQQKANRWFVIRVLQQIIHHIEVKVELTHMAGFKFSRLEFDDDITTKLEMVKKQVEIKITAADFERNLPPDKGESLAKLQQKFLDMVVQFLPQFGLTARVSRAPKVKNVGGLENLGRQVLISSGREILKPGGELPKRHDWGKPLLSAPLRHPGFQESGRVPPGCTLSCRRASSWSGRRGRPRSLWIFAA